MSKSVIAMVAGGLLLASGLSSCVSYPYAGPNEAAGGVAGALTGAAAGGIIGHQSGRGLEGAAIGGVLGALAGSVIGNAQDQYVYDERPVVRRYPARTAYVYEDYYAPPPVVYRRRYYRPYYYHHHHGYCW